MTHPLTTEVIEDLLTWYRMHKELAVTLDGGDKILELFFRDHPEHKLEPTSTSKRDEVLRVATKFAAANEITFRVAVDLAIELISEVDKRFNTKEG